MTPTSDPLASARAPGGLGPRPDGETGGQRPNWMRDSVLAVGLAVFVSLGSYFASTHQHAHRPFDAGALALIVVATGSLAWRHRYPVVVLWVTFAATLGYFLIGYASGPIWLALIVAFVTTILAGHRRAAVIAVVAGITTFPWIDHVVRHRPGPSVAGLAALVAWLLVLLGAAEAARMRRERAAEALRIREQEALGRASEERLRIARELHDALGHDLSLINVQSGVALHLNDELPDQVRSSLVAIKDASKEALGELRWVLDILRQEGEPAPRSPASTLARLDELAAQARAAGLQVRTETDGDVRPLPFGVDVAAFRIVQEALTNVARHAGPANATVRVSYGPSELVVQVDDDGRGAGATVASTPDGSHKGIVGMRERAAALGGELEAGRRPDGGFRVRARLPVEGAA
jgi:signal transduction histidine kinase